MRQPPLIPQTERLTSREVTSAVANTADWFRFINPADPDFGKKEPATAYRKRGLLAYANGSDWDPGAGEGLYIFLGAWTKI